MGTVNIFFSPEAPTAQTFLSAQWLNNMPISETEFMDWNAGHYAVRFRNIIYDPKLVCKMQIIFDAYGRPVQDAHGRFIPTVEAGRFTMLDDGSFLPDKIADSPSPPRGLHKYHVIPQGEEKEFFDRNPPRSETGARLPVETHLRNYTLHKRDENKWKGRRAAAPAFDYQRYLMCMDYIIKYLCPRLGIDS